MSNECQSSNAGTVLLFGKILFHFTFHVIPVKTEIQAYPCENKEG
jgi:hypothetical protein